MKQRKINPANLPERLRELRELAGHSQGTLATASGIHRDVIARIERGERSASIEVAWKLATALGCGIDNLLVPRQQETEPPPRGRTKKIEQ